MEYEPLFSPGFHEISLNDLENLFINIFVIKERREYLIKRLQDFLAQYSDIKLNSEIWIDGSFATKKPEPSDIDIVFFVDPNEVNNLSKVNQELLENLFGNHELIKSRYSLDVYFICKFDDAHEKIYWRGCFGFSRTGIPKGIPVINYKFI